MQVVGILSVLSCLLLVNADMTAYYKRTAKKFMSEKASDPNVIALQSGVLVEIIKSGKSAFAKSPRENDRCKVSYTGSLRDGTVYETDTLIFAPTELPLKAWRETLQMMSEGDKWRIYLPPSLGYGEEGRKFAEVTVPPYAPLVIDCELKLVMGPGKSAAEARAAFTSAQSQDDML
mmetsp:Transcript_23960/g.35169  ORF Transcript_23960/g.35169 Transcript_23960/m.35169 type:complete len:176 (+) Transcript_23960:28-555(+)